MKYKIYLTDSIEILHNEEYLGEANTLNELMSILRESLLERDIQQGPYARFLMAPTATFIDFGRWTKFAAIVPPVPPEIITGKVHE